MLEAGRHVRRSAVEHNLTQGPNWQARNDDLGPVDVTTAERGPNAPGAILARSRTIRRTARKAVTQSRKRSRGRSRPRSEWVSDTLGSARAHAQAFGFPGRGRAGGTLTASLWHPSGVPGLRTCHVSAP